MQEPVMHRFAYYSSLTTPESAVVVHAAKQIPTSFTSVIGMPLAKQFFLDLPSPVRTIKRKRIFLSVCLQVRLSFQPLKLFHDLRHDPCLSKKPYSKAGFLKFI
jgi:hypothetical protein